MSCTLQTGKTLDGAMLKAYQRRAEVLKAMAHPTRLFILELLQAKPLCVCEINALIPADVSTISKHLTVLRNAGLVSYDKRGLQVYYTLEAPCMLNALACMQPLMQL
jgi:DNA-binding transcriptional ArsR family regulator